MGARPMSRLIQDKLRKPLANEVLFGELAEGGKVEIEVNEKELSFKFTSKSKVAAESN